jgi:anti-sigma B factor antagonist
MKLDVIQKGEVTILKCSGNLDADNIALFKKAAYDILDKGRVKFVLDASSVEFVDSMGLGVLISMLRRVKQKDGDIKIASLTPDVKTIFEITKLYRLFDLCDSPQEAVTRFKGA